MFVGVDCGTQGTKAVLVDECGVVHGRGYASHGLIERSSGAREQEPGWWVEAMRVAVKAAIAGSSTNEIRAIGVSGQQHGLVVLDEARQVIRPAKLWNDTETAAQNEELVRHFGGKAAFFERFGIVPLTGYTVSKLLWLKQREPENFARIRRILLPHEYLNFWLTGEMKAEFGDASGTGYFDVRSRTWCHEILDAIDGGSGQLAAALPEFIGHDEMVGALRPEVAADLGLPPDCKVSAGGGDNMMGAIGTGNVQEGVVTLSLGTSSTVYSYSDSVVLDPTGCVAPFCSSTGGWLPLVCTMNATNVVTATVSLLGKTVQDIDGALDATEPGADGLVFLPFLNGERTPDLPGARGSIHGIAPGNFKPEALIRAVVEGVTFGILCGLDLVMAGKPVDAISVIGGGARSRAWRQLLADATGATIRVPTEDEAGALGAAMQALVAWKRSRGDTVSYREIAPVFVREDEGKSCHPRPELKANYDDARKRYRTQLEASYPGLQT
jgi:xylulokinase